ncbi:hypothetical protein [Streptomyces venezuelae]
MKPLGLSVAVVSLVLAVWLWTAAPCELWAFSKAGDMPARCISR